MGRSNDDGGLRVSEVVAITWTDVLPRDERVQLSIAGKGGKLRQVVLPEIVSRSFRCAATPGLMVRSSQAVKRVAGLHSRASVPW
jgi:site-specific recombinase XerD